jgi:hypothetical protein
MTALGMKTTGFAVMRQSRIGRERWGGQSAARRRALAEETMSKLFVRRAGDCPPYLP